MNNDRERRSPLQSVGMAALAVGAGAAILYRGGGAKLLSDGLSKATRLMDNVADDISKVALKDRDAAFISSMYKKHISGEESTWKTLREMDGKINLRNTSNNLMGAMSDFIQLQKAPLQIFSKRYDEEMITTPLKREFIDRYASNDPSKARGISSFIDDAVGKVNDAFLYETDEELIKNSDFVQEHVRGLMHDPEFITAHKESADALTAQHEEMLNAIAARIEEKQKNLPNYAEENQELMNQMLSKFDIDGLEKKFGTANDSSFIDSLRGDRPMTVNELIANEDKIVSGKIFSKSENGFSTQDAIEMLKLKRDSDTTGRFGSLFVDRQVLRMNRNDNPLSFKTFADLGNKSMDLFANTLPGKLLKTRDVLLSKDAPNWYLFEKGTTDHIISSIEENGKGTLQNNYMKILDKTYRIDRTTLTHVSELDNIYLASGQHGAIPRLMREIGGDAGRGGWGAKYGITKKLDLFTNATPSRLTELKSFITKFTDPRWGKNVINSFLDQDGKKVFEGLTDAKFIEEYFKKAKTMNKIFGETTRALDKDSIRKLQRAASGRSKEYLDLLTMDDEKLLESLLSKNVNNFKNADLASLVKRAAINYKSAQDSMNILSNKNMFFDQIHAMKYPELLRRELTKEAFLVNSAENGSYSSIQNLIKNAGLSGAKQKDARALANWAVFQNESKIYSSVKRPRSYDSITESIINIQTLFTGHTIDGQVAREAAFVSQFREDMKAKARDNFSNLQKGFSLEEDMILPNNKFGNRIAMRKAIGVTDLVKNINDGQMWKAFGKQFVAGRGSMDSVTTATLFPYFSLSRLMDPLSSLGLNFSAKHSGSVGDLAWGIATRRVLPIAGALTALSYLDYEAKNLTGTSLKGAAANSLANFDLFNRKIADGLHLTGWLKDQRELNPISQYWFGDEYKSYEEQKQYYQSGLDPVRKGRYWSFGSTSEFRGGKIAYFEPNRVLRANSDWHDIGVYGSAEEKWKHSLIPTLRHPLSPLRYLMDPYWLEKKHYWDRPYPVTGKMFEEGTPWGAVLNPTIGQLIKPVKRMHQEELGNTLVDVRSLIERQNHDVKSRAANNLIKITDTGMMLPVNYTPLSDVDPSQRVLSLQAGNESVYGAYLGSEYSKTLPYLSQFNDVYSGLSGDGSGMEMGGFSGGGTPGGLSFGDKMMIDASEGGVLGTMYKQVTSVARSIATSGIRNQNSAIFAKAANNKQNGVMLEPSLAKMPARYAAAKLTEEDKSDLLNTLSTSEFLRDAAYSAKELGGIYGFLLDVGMPSKGGRKLQNAGRMASFSRTFWDASMGGAGGEFMEIARRFFPHEDHNVEQINPLKNTMPEWMPERFRTGDPYEKLPKGEMRLPGAGYESIWRLHSDRFGKYGAFDRMKILADIAPWSQEYKMWRSVAQKTVTDPLLKAEMKEIRKRVKQQSTNHQFFDYKFNVDLETERITVGEILKSGQGFRAVGSDQVYRLAGINVTKTPEGGLERYLTPGQEVTIRYAKNKYDRNNQDGSISTIAYTRDGNLNRSLLKSGAATEKEGDQSVAAMQFKYTDMQIAKAKITELIAHAPIPYIHDKFMRIDTPLEAYKKEQVYGTPYATWNHPIQGFLMPALQKGWARGPVAQTVALASWALATKVGGSGTSAAAKVAANTLWGLTNPGAFVGGTVGFLTSLHAGPAMKVGAHVGAAIGLAGYAATRLNKPVDSTINFALLGVAVTKQMNFKKIGINIGGKEGALIGGLIGLGLSGIKNGGFNKDKMFGAYIPEKTKKKWEIEEYYDRLKYVKYQGLFEKAARKAKQKEGVDIGKIIRAYEYNREKRENLINELLASKEKLSNIYAEGDTRLQESIDRIDAKINALKYPTQIFRAGKYTRSALAYKQAADSTTYGLREGASFTEIMRATPNQYKDFIMEFSKVKDPKKRKEILKYISPYQRKVLQVAWGEKVEEQKSNLEYFSNNFLPGTFWAGWRPDQDLDHVQIKTIQNEGMLLSDFGFYDSQANDPAVQAAPEINIHHQNSALSLRKNLMTALSGAGLIGVDVSVEQSSEPGIQMVANIVRTADYQIKQKVNGIMGRVFY